MLPQDSRVPNLVSGLVPNEVAFVLVKIEEIFPVDSCNTRNIADGYVRRGGRKAYR